jgi:transposase-like protein
MEAQFTDGGICAMGTKRRSIGWPGGSRDGTPGRRQHNRSSAERQRLLERYARGGLSQRRFCERHDLPLSTLTYWLRQSRRGGTAPAVPALVELPVEIGAQTAAEAQLSDARGVVSIRLANGLEVRVGSSAEVRWVGLLLKELRACSG